MSGISELCGGISLVTPPSTFFPLGVVGDRKTAKTPVSTPLVRTNAEGDEKTPGCKVLLSINGACRGAIVERRRFGLNTGQPHARQQTSYMITSARRHRI
jgi:hypothetical protein